MRSFRTPFGKEFLETYQAATLGYRYKGHPCLKNPIDLAIYLDLLWRERPASIIEIGSKHGGSALFFTDIAGVFELGATVISIDLRLPKNPPPGPARFLEGDVRDLDGVFTQHALFALPRPWFVVEDSAHTFEGCFAAMQFFSRHLQAGEMLVVEDGVLEDLGLSKRYSGGPNRAIEEFFRRRPGEFEVATQYTDMFGVNATYNPNGYLRKL